ncbi:pyrimidine reductase family protein [Allostreptomyces psammosilenae]
MELPGWGVPAPLAPPAETGIPPEAGTPREELGAPEALDTLDGLAAAYSYPVHLLPAPDRPWLRANMVSSLDGAAHHEAHSAPLSSDADMRLFGVLRGLADAILVGAQTVRQEGYRPAKAREAFAERRAAAGQAPAPAIAVVSASLNLDFDAPLFTEPATPTILITGAGAPRPAMERARAAGAVLLVAGTGQRVDLAEAVRHLGALGHRRLLTEGGPHLLGQLVAADLLDELCLTVSPTLTAGRADRITVARSALTLPHRMRLLSLLEEDGFLFSRYVRAAAPAPRDG